MALLIRVCFWTGMAVGVEGWCDRCWTCLQYRKRPAKLPADVFTPRTDLPRQHVLCGLEGPSVPRDRGGAAYVLT